MMNKIHALLIRYLTIECYDDIFIKNEFKNFNLITLDKKSSSTGKYHQRENGEVDTIAEHTYEMIYIATKVFPMFGKDKTKGLNENSIGLNTLLLSIYFHDLFKYGLDETSMHTLKNHDELAGQFILKNKSIFENHTIFDKFYDSVRFHSGRWSTNFNNDLFTQLPFFVHITDMLSTNNCIKILDIDIEKLFKNNEEKYEIYKKLLIG